VGAGSPGAARLGAVRSGSLPLRAKSASQRGRRSPSGANRSMALRSSFSGIVGLPQSRPLANDQSSVAITPTQPAARARSSRRTIASRSPIQYVW